MFLSFKLLPSLRVNIWSSCKTLPTVPRFMEILRGATRFTLTSSLAWGRWRLRSWGWRARSSMAAPTPAALYVNTRPVHCANCCAANHLFQDLHSVVFLIGNLRRNWEHTDGLQGLQRHGLWAWCQIPWNVSDIQYYKDFPKPCISLNSLKTRSETRLGAHVYKVSIVKLLFKAKVLPELTFQISSYYSLFLLLHFLLFCT